MDDNLQKFRDSVVTMAGEFAASFGLNRVVGQLYALLYISPEAVSLDDMTTLLKISKGNASVNIRVLEEWGAVKKVWVKGSRKDFYEANPDIFGIALNRLNTGMTKRLDKASGFINQAKELLKTKPPRLGRDSAVAAQITQINGTLRVYQKRLDEMKKLLARANKLLGLASSGIIKKLL